MRRGFFDGFFVYRPAIAPAPASGKGPLAVHRKQRQELLLVAKITKTFQYGKHQVTLETGEIARQAGGAVMVKIDGTVVLVSAVAAKQAREGQDFFPLTVDYQEKFYAGGRIPGGFFKREGRPTEKETLISRLIDRPIRPLFPEDYKNEVQIIATLMSLNPEIEGDVPALIGASAAMALCGTPFQAPRSPRLAIWAAARAGRSRSCLRSRRHPRPYRSRCRSACRQPPPRRRWADSRSCRPLPTRACAWWCSR